MGGDWGPVKGGDGLFYIIILDGLTSSKTVSRRNLCISIKIHIQTNCVFSSVLLDSGTVCFVNNHWSPLFESSRVPLYCILFKCGY